MTRRSLILVPLLLTWVCTSAQAGIIFNRSKKPAPADQVAELIKTVRTNPDERQRSNAVEELGKFDVKNHPTAAAALIDTVMKDPSAAVRYEAAQALGNVRPISSQTAYALEYALTNDPSTRVRSAAKSALGQYYIAGYRPAGPSQPPQTAEPGLAAQPPPAIRPTAAKPGPRPVAQRQTAEPPLAVAGTPGLRIDAPADPPKSPYLSVPSPIKFGPSSEPANSKPAPTIIVKPEPPKPAKPAKPDDDGPILIPPG